MQSKDHQDAQPGFVSSGHEHIEGAFGVHSGDSGVSAPSDEGSAIAFLRALAEVATPGPWRTAKPRSDDAGLALYGGPESCYRIGVVSNFNGNPVNDANARYIAALSPARVLRMLDVIERSEELECMLNNYGTFPPGVAGVAVPHAPQPAARGRCPGCEGEVGAFHNTCTCPAGPIPQAYAWGAKLGVTAGVTGMEHQVKADQTPMEGNKG